MHVKTNTAEYLVRVKLDSIDIKDNVSILCISKESPSGTAKQYCYYKTSKLNTISLLNFEKDKNFNTFAVMKKGFKDYYKQTGFGLPGYDEIWEKFMYKPEKLFNLLKDDKVNIDDLEFIEVSRYDETLYPFVYGKSRTGHIPHMMRYNGKCYMITDYEYDLEKVKEFLLEKEKEGLVRICRGKNLWHRDKEEIICEIPYYNKDRENENYFINFFCLIEDKSQIPNDSFSGISYAKEWLEPFKTGRREP